MSTVFEDIAGAYADGFDAEREALFGADAKLLLLKLDGGDKEYATVETLTSSWSAYFSEYYGSTTFQVARADDDFNNTVSDSEVSHVMVIDSDNEALNNEPHEINRETTIPAGVEPFWKIRAKSIGRKFVPTEPEP
jgi:hypothetical protein